MPAAGAAEPRDSERARADAGERGDHRFAGRDWVRGRILVQPRAGMSEARLRRIVSARGGRLQREISDIGFHVVEVSPRAEEALLRALRRHPHIEVVEKDFLLPLNEVPNDPRYGDAWHLPKVDASQAWQSSKGDGIVVAVLDTGVDTAHPDLQGKLVAGWNSVDLSQTISDINGHGTRVAGVIGAATDNAAGVSALGWNARIMPIRVSNRSDGAAAASDMARGLIWAADNGAHVANMSYMSWAHATVANAAQYMRNRGGVVVGAAGNSGADAGHNPSPNVVVVAATTSSDATASWSNHGAYVDISAPGAGILTTSRGGGYSSVSGTSFAAPMVAAAAALVMAADRDLSPAQVEQALYDGADDLGAAGWDSRYGVGRLNAGRAVGLVAPRVEADLQEPLVSILSPQHGARVEDTVLIDVHAADNVGVAGVDLYVDGVLLGTDMVAPYLFSWDTAGVEGVVRLQAEAWDAAGNRGVHAVDVIVEVPPPPPPVDAEAPQVRIAEPVAGARVEGVVLVEVEATDNVAVARVDLYADGGFVGSSDEAPHQFLWDTGLEREGLVSLRAEAWDAAGNGSAHAVDVLVDRTPPPPAPDTLPPAVTITSPASGSTVEGEIRVEIDASDDVEVTLVELLVNGRLVGFDATAPYRFVWDTSGEAQGPAMLVARAYDAAGNQASHGVGVTVLRPAPVAPVVPVEPVAPVEPTMPVPPAPPVAPVQPPEPIEPPVVQFISPGDGAQVNGRAHIAVQASGSVDVATIRVHVDDTLLCSGSGASLACDWTTGQLAAGSYVLVATAEDIDGNMDMAAIEVAVVGAVTGPPSGGTTGDDGGGGVGFPLIPPVARRSTRP